MSTRMILWVAGVALTLLVPVSSCAQAPGAGAGAVERKVLKIEQAREQKASKTRMVMAAEGPGGERVAQFDGAFEVAIDLGAAESESHPGKFELIKLPVRADAHAFLVVSLENFPKPGEMSRWYVLDGQRTQQPWRTIPIDLNKPEEIKEAGTYKGMADTSGKTCRLVIQGSISEIRRSIQGPGRTIRLGDPRLARKAIDIDWDQSQAPYTWEKGKDLVFSYTLSVANRMKRPVRATIALEPLEKGKSKAVVAPAELPLGAGETKTVQATITLPASEAAKAAPLYCERYEVRAAAQGVEDSDVTLLKSSDTIPLSITLPLAEEQLAFPLLQRIKDIPEQVTAFNANARQEAMRLAESVSPEDLVDMLDGPLKLNQNRGFNYSGNNKAPWDLAQQRYRDGLTACAFLYDITGQRQYLDKGTQLLLKAAELFPARQAEWKAIAHSPISHGVFCGNTLSLGWATGSMRWPYSYARHGIFNDFDLLARDMDPQARRKILRDFIGPAAIQMRNHYFGRGNQQDVVNYPVLYAGLATRNWPLVSHAYDSTHGVLNQIQFAFDDDGMASESNYQQPSIEPILCAAEILRPRGIDLYDQRLHDILHSRAAAAIKKPYHSPMLAYADAHRFTGIAAEPPAAAKTDGSHLGGITMLRWKGLEAAMNWGVALNRSAPDRCSLRINDLGGGNYSHASLGQSIIIIDEATQNPAAARVLGYQINGPVQYICAAGDEHYPGASIIRTFALIDDGVLALDRVRCAKPSTIDWCLRGAGDVTLMKMREIPGGFSARPDDPTTGEIHGATLKFNRHFHARIDTLWGEGVSRLAMAGETGTEVFRFHVPAAFSAGKQAAAAGVPVLMARRKNVRQTDFAAYFSSRTSRIEKLPVLNADGSEADALGAQITLIDGKTFRALVNYHPGAKVRLGELATQGLFATDY